MVVLPSISQGQDLLFKFHNASKTQSYDTFFNLYQPKSVEERDSLLLFLEENKEQALDQIDSYRWLTEMYRTYSCYINWLRLKKIKSIRLKTKMYLAIYFLNFAEV